MLSLRIIESIISFLTLTIAYVIGSTTAGYFQAWVAKKMGDNTAAREGFLTWNPVVHSDPIGAFFLLYLGIGWSKSVPINPANIKGPWRLAVVYFANVIAYLALALVSLIILLRIFGINMLEIALAIIKTGYISLSMLSYAYPASSSFMLVIALILVVMVYLSVLFAVLNFFIDGFRFFVIAFFPEFEHIRENNFVAMLLQVILIMAFANTLRINVINAVSYVAYYIAQMLGAA